MITLTDIITHKKLEVEKNKSLYPVQLLESSLYYKSKAVSLKKYLLRPDKNGIIAEIKKKSPSIGDINKYANVEKISIGYMQAGASALSVLTDKDFFGGSNADLTIARKYNFCPILRKDFTIDAYQIIEAKSIGADVILLIAAVLSKENIKEFTDLAHSLEMEVILEIHDASELEKIYDKVDVIGINNRDLNTMKINIEHSAQISEMLPKNIIRISESGIQTPEHIIYLKQFGYQGFLIGSNFMKHAEPHLVCKQFINDLVEKQGLKKILHKN
ncbi:MAG: indole-3-glycerol phosphate synthase TrpC [Bacteroidetes bacterium]|nr:indole-3-glycerol phosphate synthase TrpC [Bacteroidota bacterium]